MHFHCYCEYLSHATHMNELCICMYIYLYIYVYIYIYVCICIYLHISLQHTATHCNSLQHTCNTHAHQTCEKPQYPKPMEISTTRSQLAATRCNTLPHPSTHCNTLQHTCNTPEHQKCEKPQYPLPIEIPTTRSQLAATHCNSLQHTATHCNTLQHTATHLQHSNTPEHQKCEKPQYPLPIENFRVTPAAPPSPSPHSLQPPFQHWQ